MKRHPHPGKGERFPFEQIQEHWQAGKHPRERVKEAVPNVVLEQ